MIRTLLPSSYNSIHGFTARVRCSFLQLFNTHTSSHDLYRSITPHPYPEDLEKSTHSFILYCGTKESHLPSSAAPRFISPLPHYPWWTPPPHTTPTPNGCSAIAHTAAVPRKRCGVWIARFGSTDAVIETDSQYFDHSVVVRMMKSPYGCVYKGIGCRLWCVKLITLCTSID